MLHEKKAEERERVEREKKAKGGASGWLSNEDAWEGHFVDQPPRRRAPGQTT